MNIELSKEEAQTLIAACESEEMLLSQHFARRAPNIRISGLRAHVVALQSKLSEAIDADDKRAATEAKKEAEAKKEEDKKTE